MPRASAIHHRPRNHAKLAHMPRLAAPLALVTFLAIAAATATASADLPPSPGTKRVPFGFMVKGLSAAPDRVLFAYPCGGSDGAPISEHRKLEDGVVVGVGRRGGNCLIYSIAKPAYEAWAKDYKPSMSSSDPALQALAAQSALCKGAPSIVSEISSKDPRTGITETLNVTTLDAKTCVLTPVADPPAPAATTPAPASSPAPASNSAPAAKSGCSSTGMRTESNALAFAALACAGLLAARRRRPSL
jgi:hypothetical protein